MNPVPTPTPTPTPTTLLLLLATASVAVAQNEPAVVRETVLDLPLVADSDLPTAETLLTDRPVDWIEFTAGKQGDRLLVVEPMADRPNPLQIATARVEKAQADLTAAIRREIDLDVEEARTILNQSRLLRLHLAEDPFGFEYEVDIDEIVRIRQHEDLALERAGLLIREGRLDTAWELVTHVRRRDPNWPRLEQTINEVLFADGERLLGANQPERALAVLDQLWERDRRFLNLDTRYAAAVRTLSTEAFAAENYRRSRYYLSRLRSRFPGHRTVGELTQTFERAASAEVARGRELIAAGDRRGGSEAARRAGKMWPDLGRDKRAFDQLLRQYPILHVGTLACAEPAASPLLEGPANWRYNRLTRPRLFHERAIDADLVRYGSDFVEDWQPEELGRRVDLALKSRQPRSQAQPILSSYGIADALLAAVGDSSRYGDRYSATLLGVRPARTDRLELRLGLQPLRVQALLATIPLGGPGAFVPATDEAATLGARQSTRHVRLVRSHRPDDLPGAIVEVVEHQFADGDQMIRALRRAEVDMLSDVPLFTAVKLLQDASTRDQAIAGPCSLPETHILQFRPGGVLAQTTELRRGLAVAFRREDILVEAFLGRDRFEVRSEVEQSLTAERTALGNAEAAYRDAEATGKRKDIVAAARQAAEREQRLFDAAFRRGMQSRIAEIGRGTARLTTSMFPSFSYARDSTIDLRDRDRFAATALGLVGKRQLGPDNWGPWRMVTPSDVRSRRAAELVVEQMRETGFPVELVPLDKQAAAIAADDWEILYRRVQVAEPLVELWPVLALGQDARIGELTHLPETLRRRLLDLERVESWNDASTLLKAIDRSIWATAIIVPLWEMDRITLRRRSLRDAPTPPLWPYDSLDQWRLEPAAEKTLD